MYLAEGMLFLTATASFALVIVLHAPFPCKGSKYKTGYMRKMLVVDNRLLLQ